MKNLTGLGMRGYRSFYGEMQFLYPMGKITLLAGQNNTGKSNVIKFAYHILNNMDAIQGAAGRLPTMEHLDSPQNLTNSAGIEFAIAYGSIDEIIHTVEKILANKQPYHPSMNPSSLETIFSSPVFHQESGEDLVWFQFIQVGDGRNIDLSPLQLDEFNESSMTSVTERILHSASSVLTGHTGSSGVANLRNIISALNPLGVLPQVELVEAFRQVRPQADRPSIGRYSGNDLIIELAKLKDPDVAALGDQYRFENINRFIRNVLEDGSATLSIPHHRQAIYVKRGELTLPLSNLGTGVEQVVILAAAATLLEEKFVCIEEPEIHLHPILQRKLLRYLAEETTNQYLIATHSAHMLDAELASIFHVTHTGDGTQIKHAAQPKDRAAICADLGYRPSDLVQANAVLWVEGPSDRIYLRHWLSLVDDSLIEGIHYSIMFYGGRLLNHLTADDPDVGEFISLRRLNRHISILIDSDKTSPHGRINTTKMRVRDEFNKGPGFAWITKGYTIENYIPPSFLSEAVSVCHPRAKFRWEGQLYVNPLALSNPSIRADKIAIARQVVQLWNDGTEFPHDLNKHLHYCVQFIRSANGFS